MAKERASLHFKRRSFCYSRFPYFQLTAFGNGQTRFIQGEKFSGVLVGLFLHRMEAATKAGFDAMNRALKERAEAAIDQGYHDISEAPR